MYCAYPEFHSFRVEIKAESRQVYHCLQEKLHRNPNSFQKSSEVIKHGFMVMSQKHSDSLFSVRVPTISAPTEVPV
jgi:hypothetical protein